jgi:hypothetical protein
MSAYTSGVANSVCMSKAIIASATDASDGSITIDFGINKSFAYVLQVKDDSNVLQDPADLVLTEDAGVVTIANGVGDSITENYTYTVIAVIEKI